jgi:hypothetical protein
MHPLHEKSRHGIFCRTSGHHEEAEKKNDKLENHDGFTISFFSASNALCRGPPPYYDYNEAAEDRNSQVVAFSIQPVVRMLLCRSCCSLETEFNERGAMISPSKYQKNISDFLAPLSFPSP